MELKEYKVQFTEEGADAIIQKLEEIKLAFEEATKAAENLARVLGGISGDKVHIYNDIVESSKTLRDSESFIARNAGKIERRDK